MRKVLASTSSPLVGEGAPKGRMGGAALRPARSRRERTPHPNPSPTRWEGPFLLFTLPLLLTACGEIAAPPANMAEPSVAESTAAIPASSAPSSAPTANQAVAMPPFAEVEGAHPYGPPEPAPIPAAFRGTWAESKALCGDLDHQNRLGISGATVRFPDFIVRTDDVRTLGPREIEIKGVIEGTNRPSDHHFFIDAAGDTLTDGGGGGAVRVRCSG